METQKYTININLYRKITSTKMKHSNLLVSVISLFTNTEKTNKSKKQKQKQYKKQTKKEVETKK